MFRSRLPLLRVQGLSFTHDEGRVVLSNTRAHNEIWWPMSLNARLVCSLRLSPASRVKTVWVVKISAAAETQRAAMMYDTACKERASLRRECCSS